MKNGILTTIAFLVFTSCSGQKLLTYKNLKYVGFSYHGTLNKAFINKKIIFLNGNDTVVFNLKLPFESTSKNIYDPGIFYNCSLKKDTLYTFNLKKASISELPKEYVSYYTTNGIFSKKNSSKYKEISKDTKFQYQGTNLLFIDLNNELFVIQKMTPATDCVFQH